MAKKMKCYKCDGKLEKTKENIEVLEGSKVYEETEVFKCNQCGEILMDSDQIKELRKKVDVLKIKRKLGISGNALVLRIPKDLQKFYGLEVEDIVEIIPINKHRFIVEIT
ncbi:MAG: YgiT-type zinc finger protein [Thermoplasmata archaeon]|nr:YgiT-type zinc finger protein [Thermoplasmata archaeon]